MSLNKEYKRGFTAGYKQGLLSGLHGGNARAVMENDLVYIYGVGVGVLEEDYGFSQEEAQRFVERVQKKWFELPDGNARDRRTMAEYVRDTWGVELEQMVEGVINC